MRHVRLAFLALAALAGALAGAAALAAAPASALVSTGDGTWFWQTPQPQGNPLDDVTFVDAHTAWAVGEGGTILHSIDGGLTWVSVRSHAGNDAPIGFHMDDLHAVCFADPAHGWAVGTGIYATSDGGATWSYSWPDGAGWLEDVTFGEATHGWAVGGHNVLRTTDGGASWVRSVIHGADLYRVTAVDATDCWVGDRTGHVFHSSDGGATWKRVGDVVARLSLPRWSPVYVGGLVFSDALTGWAAVDVGPGGGIGASAWSGRLMKTVDGGRTWRRVLTSGDYLSDVAFPTGDDGWLLGYTGGTATIWHTTDGGATWASRSVGYVDSAAAIATSGDSACVVGSTILRSGDAGATWTARSDSFGFSITDIAMADSRHGWAIGDRPWWLGGAAGPYEVLMRTEDGVSWTTQTVSGWDDRCEAVAAVDADTAWVVGFGGSIAHTTNGGATWTCQASGTKRDLSDVDFVDALHGWAVGGWSDLSRPGVVLRTTDGGATWTRLPVSSLPQYFAVDFVDQQHGWMVSTRWPDNGVVQRTTDGGDTWQRTRLPMWYANDVDFTDALHGWVVGDPGNENPCTIARTTDGGATWTPVPGLRRAGASTIEFVDSTTGWVVCGDGNLHMTTDAGQHWSRAETGVGGDVYAVDAVDATHVWLGVDCGILATVDTSADTAPPVTLDDADGPWHAGAVTVKLSAADIGPSGVVKTEYRIDAETIWHDLGPAGSVEFPAPPDHSGDGQHTLTYRSTDAAGNVELARTCMVGIDTITPVPLAPKRVVARRRARAHLPLLVQDASSPQVTVRIVVKDAAGVVVRRVDAFTCATGAESDTAASVRCTFPPGRYTFFVYATDLAGTPQAVPGQNVLVVRAR